MVNAIIKELELRTDELLGQEIDCIYFGGGTPSLLKAATLDKILATVKTHYKVTDQPEITLEANPDDLNLKKAEQLSSIGINRLSIGIQSFFNDDLKLMNRAHNAQEAKDVIQLIKPYFTNYSIDLIYGIPGMSTECWQQNLNHALDFDVPHISAYALTVEPKTALAHFIDQGTIAPVDEDQAKAHYHILLDTLEAQGYSNYEFSNFGKPGFHSRNNTAYWQGDSYIGIGPGAHSYDGHQRAWNISNNPKYIKAINQGNLPQEVEHLSPADKYNEFIMTRLRIQEGISLQEITQLFGETQKTYLLRQAQQHLNKGFLNIQKEYLTVTKKGKFLSDGIASDLFWVD